MQNIFRFTYQLIYVLFAVPSFVFMAALAAIGLSKIGRGVASFFLLDDPDAAADAVMSQTLKGLEVLFLSPLAFIIVNAIAKYLGAIVDWRLERLDRERALEHARGHLLAVKAFVISLMIAVIATDLVEQILGPTGLSTEAVLLESLVIVVLGGYLVALEIFASKNHRN